MTTIDNCINLNDIYKIYVQSEDSSSGISAETIIPLSAIFWDSSGLDEEAINTFKEAVSSIIIGSKKVRNKSKPDPIAALLMNADTSPGDAAITESDYRLFEQSRIADKWRGNRIGELNELMACMLNNIKMSSSGKLDVEVEPSDSSVGTIAELKNRFNTMNAASAIKTRKTMESLVFSKASEFHGLKAALVERIPKKDGAEIQFNPSNPDIGMRGEAVDNITRVGLQQFLAENGDNLLYLKAIVIIAQVLNEHDQLPKNYDMKFIFNLLKESIT